MRDPLRLPKNADAGDEEQIVDRIALRLGYAGRLAELTQPVDADIGRDISGELVAQARTSLDVGEAAAEIEIREALGLKQLNARLKSGNL
jgi:hypothetical protein